MSWFRRRKSAPQAEEDPEKNNQACGSDTIAIFQCVKDKIRACRKTARHALAFRKLAISARGDLIEFEEMMNKYESKIVVESNREAIEGMLRCLTDLEFVFNNISRHSYSKVYTTVPIKGTIVTMSSLLSELARHMQCSGKYHMAGYFHPEAIVSDCQFLYGRFADPFSGVISQQFMEVKQLMEQCHMPVPDKMQPVDDVIKRLFNGNFSLICRHEQFRCMEHLSPRVRKGMHLVSQELVVIKEMNLDETSSKDYEQEMKKFDREILTFANVNSPYIVRFIGATRNSPHWLVTEFVPHCLHKCLQEKKLDSLLKTHIAYEIACGMAYMHQKSLTHRELSSAHVLLDEKMNVKLSHFESARELDGRAASGNIGDEAYRAPEAYGEHYDNKVDVYSYGVILYEMLNDGLPKNLTRYLEQNDEGIYLNSDLLLAGAVCDENLKNMIAVCLDPSPEARPTFSQILQEMEAQKIMYPMEDEAKKEEMTSFYYHRELANKKDTAVIVQKIIDKMGEVLVGTHQKVYYRAELLSVAGIVSGYRKTFSDAFQTNEISKEMEIDLQRLLAVLNNLSKFVFQCNVEEMKELVYNISVTDRPNVLLEIMDKLFLCMCALNLAGCHYIKQDQDVDVDMLDLYDLLKSCNSKCTRIEEEMKKIDELLQTRELLDSASHKLSDGKVREEEEEKCEVPQEQSRDDTEKWVLQEFQESDFTKETTIGAGYSGSVIRGFHNTTKRAVAMKPLADILTNDIGSTSGREYVEREVKIMATYRHPSLVGLVGVTKTHPYYLITEFCENGDLSDHIYDNKRDLTPIELTRILFDVAKGMAFLHSKHIMHRDLKPKNILLDGSNRAKICDFGFSREESSDAMSHTNGFGTFLYMAPEMMADDAYDSSVDVYAFGLIAYECWTGKKFWQALLQRPKCALGALMRFVSDNKRPALPNPGTALTTLIAQCWSGVPVERPKFSEIVEYMIANRVCIPGCDDAELEELYTSV